ncbi:MAG: hypothetical protein U0835_24190 [Isosphaeraceae bacterium]
MKDRLVTVLLSVAATYGLMKAGPEPLRVLEVDRLIVRKELIVSDTGAPWEKGYEAHQIPRGIYARALGDGPGGLWVRSRLIKGEVDDPFDDRVHAVERDGSLRRPGAHLLERLARRPGVRWRSSRARYGVERDPRERWGGDTHPGRLRFQTFRPGHPEPLTDALIGQGMMSVGGGGYGGGGLPYPSETLELWGGGMRQAAVATPAAPAVVKDDGSGEHTYALIAIGPQGRRTGPSPLARAKGRATLEWDSAAGADSYIVLRDGRELAGPLRIEGARKRWEDVFKP